MSNDVKVYHQYEDDKKESYQSVVDGWNKSKKEMLESTENNRIQRWSYSNGMFKYFNNPGKVITDRNPYINIVDTEEFDLSIKNHPFPPDPPAFNNKNRPNFFGTLMDEYVDESDWYKDTLHTSYERILREAKGQDLPQVHPEKQMDEKDLKKAIFDYAKSRGFVSVGVTKIDRRFISVEVDDEIIFDTIILLGYEMPHEVVHRYPKPEHDTAAYYGYAHCAAHVHEVADFIRSKGYDCRARSWEGFIKYSVHAVNAGLGNFSTYGIVHTPECGTRIKYTSVIIDADLELDEPIDYNIEEFCARCRMCQKSCPSGAIPKEESRYRGTVKRTTDHIKCFDMMAIKHECVQCIRVCPISMLGYENALNSLPTYYKHNLDRPAYKTNYKEVSDEA
ncbi:hypothetical protein EZV73_11305 [Acidaminobacter sp. JC074]|uniref:reductive dehalogenase domain-containing protein n=1 Tax=Acidaminobacter sp. JC074 TaxID=2530199 RepID=UPI001F10A0F2|nr:reductive dehalogenase domain-containing protein [Acidaminobacter sp. JC074]MCH4888164.1 hypothetical protein [Acidaminobacter sp. JC074]